MFRKLRLRLSLMNAAVAALILLAIAGVSYYFVARIITRQTEQALGTIVHDVEGMNFRASYVGSGNLYPFFIFSVDKDGIYQPVIQSGNIELTANQAVDLLTQAIVREQSDKQNAGFSRMNNFGTVTIVRRPNGGVIRLPSGETFRYAITSMRGDLNHIYFIFMDNAHEEELLGSVRLALGLAVVGGLILTVLGGLFLAGRALRPIRAAWQKQRSFVADASHELRSPLAAIRCNLDVVLDDTTAPISEKQIYWEGISEETARMSVLVDELLLLARADSDAVVLQKERVNILETAESAVSFMQPVAAKKGLALAFDPVASPAVAGDRARLKQVLIALIDNAVKYTPEGGSVTLTVRSTKDKAMIEVNDTGIGIAPEHLNKIFDRFYRVDKARERESGGHGLGLSIAQWIVQQLGGSISVASEEGKGSCFTVSLPILKE